MVSLEIVPGAESVEETIFVKGSAEAEHELVAFDRALDDAGIHNANILKISSVIPEGAEMKEGVSREEVEKKITPGGFYPVVVSKQASSTPGEQIFAAIAGCKLESGYGLNVEHHGSGESREEVREKCESMLEEMAERRGEDIVGETVFCYEETEVEEQACVLSAVLYC